MGVSAVLFSFAVSTPVGISNMLIRQEKKTNKQRKEKEQSKLMSKSDVSFSSFCCAFSRNIHVAFQIQSSVDNLEGC